MELINNVSKTLKDDLSVEIKNGSKLSIAAACFSIYAFQELKNELTNIDELRFIFTSPTFVTEKAKKEKREFYIPRLNRERSLYGTEFEIKLRNELTQKAIAKECAEWIREKVTFKSNVSDKSIQGQMVVDNVGYTPIDGFTTVELGCEKGNSISTTIVKDESLAQTLLRDFNEIWNDSKVLQEVTDEVIDNITAAYNENSPDFIYFVTLYNIFNEFLEDVSEDVLPNEATGFKESKIWNMLYNFQKDAALAIINKLEKYNGCILADSVGLGKTFTALAVIKYYENRNKSVLVLCPKKLTNNWNTYKDNYVNNPIASDRLRYDVLYHTDLNRTRGMSKLKMQTTNKANENFKKLAAMFPNAITETIDETTENMLDIMTAFHEYKHLIDYEKVDEITDGQTFLYVVLPQFYSYKNENYEFVMILVDYKKLDLKNDYTYWGNGLQDIMNCEMNPIPQLEKKQMPTKIAELNWKTETDEIKLKKCVVAPITYMEQYKEEISSAAIHVEWKKKYLKNEEKTIQKIETYLYNSHDQSFRYRIYSPEIELRNNTIKVMTSLQAINKVALLFMAVFLTGMIAIYQLRFEHREESYGISLAYGAQYKELYWEIFCEILLLNSIGTIIGIVIGYLVTYYVDFGIMISVVNVQGSWYTFLSAYGLCVVLSSFVSVITFRKLKKKKIIELLNVY